MSVTAYLSLFVISFAAATVLPLQSEAVLSGLLLTKGHSAWLLVAVAGVGNTLGAVVNWGLGRQVERFRNRAWFPVRPAALERAKGWYARYGRGALLLSWMPFIGDPLTLAAGVMKEKLPVFVALVGIAKTARYAALALTLA